MCLKTDCGSSHLLWQAGRWIEIKSPQRSVRGRGKKLRGADNKAKAAAKGRSTRRAPK